MNINPLDTAVLFSRGMSVFTYKTAAVSLMYPRQKHLLVANSKLTKYKPVVLHCPL